MVSRTRVAAIAIPVLISAPAVYVTEISADGPARLEDSKGLDGLLRSMGFNPINPPSNIIGLGSIYQVSADGREYRTICPVDPALLAGSVFRSPSTQTVAEQLQRASYALEGQLAKKISDRIGSDSTESVRYSLSNVELVEVPLATNRMIFAELTEAPECRAEVDFELANNQFVCQGQAILAATAEYGVGGASDVTDVVHLRQTTAAVKEVIEADTAAEISASGTKIVTGSALHYGVKVNPLCVAPPHSRFARELPRNRFDRFLNFIKFRILEGVLPATAG